MMKKFLLIVCGSFVGTFLALFFCIIASMIMSFAIMGASSMGSKKTASVDKNSILYIALDGDINERGGGTPVSMMDMMNGNQQYSQGLNVLLAAIKEAKDNKKIDGILIDCKGGSASPATREALRRSLADFKQQSGKWIWAFGNEGIDQGDYYVASVADSIFINPVGAVDIHGFASVTPFFKRLFDKVGVEMQVIRVGTFKSAVEPYILDSISPANRLQQEHYIGAIWKEMADTMAAGRKLTNARINQLADSLLVAMEADSLLKYKIVDGLCYRHDFEKKLKAKTNVDEKDDLKLVYPEDLAPEVEETTSSDQIAVVYATGEIDAGGGSVMGRNDGIDSEELSDIIYDLIKEDKVKGMVLRVNSPGGSAFGSEQIWEAVNKFKQSGKPVAVSMGDYAASGGYYISCGADRIFAERTTITGSIGIFGMIPNGEKLIKDNLYINSSEVATNDNAAMGAGMFGIPMKRLTPTQLAALQRMVNNGYELFTKRCADGRHVSQDSIKKIAEGRVWDGVTAKQIGLVDEFGGLEKAVKWVADKAGMKPDKYKTQNYPALEPDWRAMLNAIMAQQMEARMRSELGDLYDYHRQLQIIAQRQRILCLMEPLKLQ